MFNAHGKNGATAVLLFVISGGMVGLTFASVGILSRVSGHGGTPEIAAGAKGTKLSDKTITVQFNANVNKGLPWEFRPAQRQVTVRGGQETEVSYLARNISDQIVTATATYNVTPGKAAPYFANVDCFCFAEQKLKPGEGASMAVSFYVDSKIFTNPATRGVGNITLSFTFFRTKSGTVTAAEHF